MFRGLGVMLAFNAQDEQMLKYWDEVIKQTNDPKVHKYRDEIASEVVPKSKRKDLARSFNIKVEFLQERDRIEPREGRVLKKLHAYRNELYHRDSIRAVTIRSACLLYLDIVCSLLEKLPQSLLHSLVDELPPVLAKYRQPEEQWGAPSANVIARQLRSGLGIDNISLKQILIAHLSSRLDELEANISHVEQALFGPHREKEPSRPWRNLVIQLAQVHENYDTPPSFKELLKLRLKYSGTSIMQWRQSVASINELNDKLDLFANFADIEDEFEPFEIQVDGLVERVDFEVQREEDLRRGK